MCVSPFRSPFKPETAGRREERERESGAGRRERGGNNIFYNTDNANSNSNDSSDCNNDDDVYNKAARTISDTAYKSKRGNRKRIEKEREGGNPQKAIKPPATT